MKKQMMLLLAAGIAGPAWAQSSVTLYGIIDTGIGYQSSGTSLGSTSGGRSSVKMVSGVLYGDRVGLKGSEDLGGGTQAIFQLEMGFNSATGGQQYPSAAFGRQAWVGLTNPTYGTFTMGRQYTAYWMLLAPYGPTTWTTGYYGAHPGDLDSLDMVYRANNSLVYKSPSLHGVTVAGSYSLGGVAGSFNRGSTWSAAIQYASGPIGIAAGFQRINNSTPGGGPWGADSTTTTGGQPGVSALNNGYQTAQAQQRAAIMGDWQFAERWDISLSYSNVQYVPGTGSRFTDTAIFNTLGSVLHWKASPAWDLGLGYSYTRATKANGIDDNAQYHQLVLSQYYSISKRTQFYLLEGYQRATGKTLGTNGVGDIIAATASVGDGQNSAPSSTGSQFIVGVGIAHKF